MDGILLPSEFLAITDLKRLPFGRIVTEPLAQLRARSQLFQPQFHRRPLFGQTARPQSIDQDSPAVLSGRPLVDSLQTDHRVSSCSWVTGSRASASHVRHQQPEGLQAAPHHRCWPAPRSAARAIRDYHPAAAGKPNASGCRVVNPLSRKGIVVDVSSREQSGLGISEILLDASLSLFVLFHRDLTGCSLPSTCCRATGCPRRGAAVRQQHVSESGSDESGRFLDSEDVYLLIFRLARLEGLEPRTF